MAMPRKRPLEDPEQPYVYVWRLEGCVLWVGTGKNNRGRPTCKASWSGRPQALRDVLEVSRYEIRVEIIPCRTKPEAVDLERSLIKELQPKYNTAPQAGGWKGMHTPEGIESIKAARSRDVLTERQVEARRRNAIALNERKRANAHPH